MRQSASVITLLVGSAAAADYPLGGSGGSQVAAGYGAGYYIGSANTGSGKVQNALLYSDPDAYTNLANRQAAYAPNRTLGGVAYTSSPAAAQAWKLSASLTENAIYTTSAGGAAPGGGSGCPTCILGGGVWCSATYAY